MSKIGIDPGDNDETAPAKAENQRHNGRVTGLAAAFVVLVSVTVLWRVAGDPTPWRAKSDQRSAVPSLTEGNSRTLRPAQRAMPPPETFAAIFSPCAHCHEIGLGARTMTGPPLTGIIGRKAASYPQYPYSQALRDSGIVWDEATLARFIAAPQAVAPGTRMTPGILPQSDIDALVAYIETAGAQDDITKTYRSRRSPSAADSR